MWRRADWWMAFAAAVFAAVIGIKAFEPWPQVLELWQGDISPVLLLGHPHFFRYLVAYPGFLLDARVPGLGFPLYVAAFFACNVSLWRQLIGLTGGRAPAWAWGVFLAAHLAMNGRGVIAWTAWLLAACLCLQMSRATRVVPGLLFKAGLACLLGAVSTGVFIVVVGALVLFYPPYRRAGYGLRRRWQRWLTMALALPLLYLVVGYFWLALHKNLDFYGGGWVGAISMLQHGMGMFLMGGSLRTLVGVIVLIPMLVLVGFLSVAGRPWSGLQKLMLLPLFGGFFGFTVLTLLIPVALTAAMKCRGANTTSNGISRPQALVGRTRA